MKNRIILLLPLLICLPLAAQTGYQLISDVPYVPDSESDAYRKARCKLDLYYPTGQKDYPTVIWFHGGGLTDGEKHIPDVLKGKGLAVVAVNYRLSPQATHPDYTLDAAEAVAWVCRHIRHYGGNEHRIYVAGHSAGGYLTLMLALDPSYLQRHHIEGKQIAAWFPISGQTITHFTIRHERNLPQDVPVLDSFAPLSFVKTPTTPLYLITADRHLELPGRYEENALLYAYLRNAGNKHVELHELQGFDHGNVYEPGCLMMLHYIRRQASKAHVLQ